MDKNKKCNWLLALNTTERLFVQLHRPGMDGTCLMQTLVEKPKKKSDKRKRCPNLNHKICHYPQIIVFWDVTPLGDPVYYKYNGL